MLDRFFPRKESLSNEDSPGKRKFTDDLKHQRKRGQEIGLQGNLKLTENRFLEIQLSLLSDLGKKSDVWDFGQFQILKLDENGTIN